MLNRIKKNLIAVITGMLLALPVFAVDSTVTYININNKAYQDVEIAITEKAEILVPFKQLADIFNIPYNANRVDKQIGFKTFDGKEGVINQNGVFIQDYPITNKKPVFIKQGIMDGVFNEAYIPSDAASKIFGAKISGNYEDLTLLAQVERDIPLLHKSDAQTENKGPKAYS